MSKPDSVGIWKISLPDGVHEVEFEHGTTSGKRVIWVDGREHYRKDWMFKLVGRENFEVGESKAKCSVSIEAVSGFAYEYTIEVNGKCLEKFRENQRKKQKAWTVPLYQYPERKPVELYRVCLELDTLDVWVNGHKVETADEFTDDGTERHFQIDDTHLCTISTVSSGNKRGGLIHSLSMDGCECQEHACE